MADNTEHFDIREMIDAIPRLSAEEELECARKAAEGSKAAADSLVQANLWAVTDVISEKFSGYDDDKGDLFAAGCCGLSVAISEFDYTCGVRLADFARDYIISEITELIDEDRVAAVPKDVKDNLLKLRKTVSDYKANYFREPTTEEIAEELGITAEEADALTVLFKTMYGGTLSPDETAAGTADESQAESSGSENTGTTTQGSTVIEEVIIDFEPFEKEIARYFIAPADKQAEIKTGICKKYGIADDNEWNKQVIGVTEKLKDPTIIEMLKEAAGK